jgi:Zn-dependent protease
MLLLVINLLVPIYPFDAGRTFMNLCTKNGIPIRRAVQASSIIGLFWLVAGAGFFVYQLAAHNGGYSRGLFILLFGWMIFQIGTKWLTREEADCRKLKLTQP